MSIGKKLKEIFTVPRNTYEEYGYDEENPENEDNYTGGEDLDDTRAIRKPERPGVYPINTHKKDQNDYHYEPGRPRPTSRTVFQEDNVNTPQSETPGGIVAQIIRCEPASFDDTNSIADLLKQDNAVTINLKSAESDMEAQRILDFFSGVIYTINGEIQPLGDRIYILVPESIVVTEQQKARLKAQGILPSFFKK